MRRRLRPATSRTAGAAALAVVALVAGGCGGGRDAGAPARERLSDVAVTFQHDWNARTCDPVVQPSHPV